MSARRGKKIEGGLAAVAVAPPVEAVVYVAGPRGLKVGLHLLPEGVEVPGAASWPRREAWERSRVLFPVAAGEPYTSYEDYIDSLTVEEPALEVAEAEV